MVWSDVIIGVLMKTMCHDDEKKGGETVRRGVWLGLFALVLACFLCEAALAQPAGGAARGRRRPGPRGRHPKVGEVLPDFTVHDVKGKEVKLSHFRGKSIFVLELGACT